MYSRRSERTGKRSERYVENHCRAVSFIPEVRESHYAHTLYNKIRMPKWVIYFLASYPRPVAECGWYISNNTLCDEGIEMADFYARDVCESECDRSVNCYAYTWFQSSTDKTCFHHVKSRSNRYPVPPLSCQYNQPGYQLYQWMCPKSKLLCYRRFDQSILTKMNFII